jgi:hypothetical protein
LRADNDGLSIWYGGPDTPGPAEDGVPRSGQSVVVAIKPSSAGNVVAVRYRVGSAPERVIPAYEIGKNYALDVQYFRAAFPPLLDGDTVDYVPVVSCSGRQAPAPGKVAAFSSCFRLTDPPPAAEAPTSSLDKAPFTSTFLPKLTFVASVKAEFSRDPEVIGDTPDGLRINYYLDGGTIRGPGLQGTFQPRGADYLTIRRDGVAIINVRATMKMEDGTLITEHNSGFLDMGEDGYDRALRGDFPDQAALQVSPRLTTAHARYLWVNRHEFVGVGRVSTVDSLVEYDMFMVESNLQVIG